MVSLLYRSRILVQFLICDQASLVRLEHNLLTVHVLDEHNSQLLLVETLARFCDRIETVLVLHNLLIRRLKCIYQKPFRADLVFYAPSTLGTAVGHLDELVQSNIVGIRFVLLKPRLLRHQLYRLLREVTAERIDLGRSIARGCVSSRRF